MKIRFVAMTLVTIFTGFLIIAPLLTGCGDSQVKNSNTNSVENVKEDKNEEKDSGWEAGEMNKPVAEEKKTAAYAPMKEIKGAVVDIIGENYWPDKQLTAEELEIEADISKDLYEEFLAEQQSIETDIDTMIIIKAKSDKISEVETKLNEYRDSLMLKFKDRPQELGKVEASRIETIDSYICFVQLGADTSEAAKKGDEEIILLCQQDNERAVDVIEKTILDQ